MSKYTVPSPAPSVRRVYVLPEELVTRIHEYGFDNGHSSEVAAVRELLTNALSLRDEAKKKGGDAFENIERSE